MKKEELLKRIAPCSLMCHTCVAYQQGVICESANQLLKYLEGVGEFYEKHRPNESARFHIFAEELERYGSGKCSGCRNREHHGCSIQDCFILECTKGHNVNFCGECKAFPCDRARDIFEREVYAQWLEGNQEIKTCGIDAFWKKNSIKPHYRAYKKR